MTDLEEAIRLGREAIETTPKDHPNRAGRLNNLGSHLGDRFSRTGAMADLEEAIQVVWEAIKATPQDHPDRPSQLNNLVAHLGDRYSRTGAMADLEEAIRLGREAIEATPQDHPDRAGLLNNLGNHLDDRFSRTGAMTDLNEAIRLGREAIEATPKDHPHRDSLLNNLGNRLGDRYSRTGAMADLEEAIQVVWEAIEATPKDHPDRPTLLNNLGVHLGDRYSRTAAMADLEEAIQVGREVIDATPQDHPARAGRLNNLGNRLGDRYSRTAAMADLEEAIQVVREAIKATPQDHPHRAGQLNNLGTHLGDRYSRTGAMTDLEEAIQVGREAIKATPKDHPDRPSQLNNLGNHLGDRYSRTGAMADLEEAIQVGREAIEATPKDHPDRSTLLNNLGNHLRDRYSRTGAMADLEEAIQVVWEAIKATPKDHPDRPSQLNSLGVHLGDRYSRTAAMADLEEAIQVGREAIEATPKDHPDRAGWLNNLGNRLGDRYSHTGAMADLEEAIQVGWEAIKATPQDHPDRAGQLNNLAAHLGDRYSRTGAMADLEEAIRLGREALETTPQDHPDRAGLLNNLGNHLGDRYSRTGAMADLEEAKISFTLALKNTSSAVSIRVAAGRHFLSTPFILKDPQAYTITKETIDLIPFLTPRSLQNTDKRHLLSEAVGLSSDAAAIALHVNKRPATAVELLETGRGVIAGALFEQADVSALESEHADLARRFIELRNQLDTPVSTGSLDTIDRRTAAAEAEAEGGRRREAEQQLIGLLKKIRLKPGFDRFLRSASEADMLAAAQHGPILVVNVSLLRCDALVIDGRPESIGVRKGIRLVDLPQLSVETINNRAGRLRSVDTLGWLWDVTVGPILADLGFTETPSDGQWPHVWWVPTGKLVRFPLHAAGHHRRRNGETALDRVVSSYASSVKAIIHARQRPQQVQVAQEPESAVVVAMKKTRLRRRLKFTNDEVEALAKICESMKLVVDRPKRNKNAVLSALEACKIFHFAGHGETHPIEPLQSRLLLEDWQQEPLTVASLLEASLSSQAPFLAYLSACGTGQVLDESSVDESIHVANAFQLAGFRHVVGTLWSVDDRLCVEVAKMTYEYLLDKGIEDEFVSRGLHQASRRLRDQWVHDKPDARHWPRGMIVDAVGNGKDANLQKGSLAWVPYVHYGV